MKPQTARARRLLPGAAENYLSPAPATVSEQSPARPRPPRPPRPRPPLIRLARSAGSVTRQRGSGHEPPRPGGLPGLPLPPESCSNRPSPELPFQQILTFYWSLTHRRRSPPITGATLRSQKAGGSAPSARPLPMETQSRQRPKPPTPPPCGSVAAPPRGVTGTLIFTSPTFFFFFFFTGYCVLGMKSCTVLCAFLCSVQRALKMAGPAFCSQGEQNHARPLPRRANRASPRHTGPDPLLQGAPQDSRPQPLQGGRCELPVARGAAQGWRPWGRLARDLLRRGQSSGACHSGAEFPSQGGSLPAWSSWTWSWEEVS